MPVQVVRNGIVRFEARVQASNTGHVSFSNNVSFGEVRFEFGGSGITKESIQANDIIVFMSYVPSSTMELFNSTSYCAEVDWKTPVANGTTEIAGEIIPCCKWQDGRQVDSLIKCEARKFMCRVDGADCINETISTADECAAVRCSGLTDISYVSWNAWVLGGDDGCGCSSTCDTLVASSSSNVYRITP